MKHHRRGRGLLHAVIALLGIGLAVAARAETAKTILFVDSYHAEYPWSAAIRRGVGDALQGSPHHLQVHAMDTKRNASEDFKHDAGRKALRLIETMKPAVIIACDDNAAAYLVAPYLASGPYPVVFCGINWNASAYGLPTAHVTGIVEVTSAERLVSLMAPLAAGRRIGYLSVDTENDHIHYENITGRFPELEFVAVRFVKTMSGYVEAYREMQDQCDMLILPNNAGIADWDDAAARRLVQSESRVISGTFDDWMMPYVAIGVIKSGEEQGRWAAQAALRILAGAKPAEIPVVANRDIQIMLNRAMLERLGFAAMATRLAGVARIVD